MEGNALSEQSLEDQMLDGWCLCQATCNTGYMVHSAIQGQGQSHGNFLRVELCHFTRRKVENGKVGDSRQMKAVLCWSCRFIG